MLDSGIYLMAGDNAVGTYPSYNSQFGILFAVKRGARGQQILIYSNELYTRSIGDSDMTAWTAH